MPLDDILFDTDSDIVHMLGRHLGEIQREETEYLAAVITRNLTDLALNLLETMGYIKRDTGLVSNELPEDEKEAKVISMAEALLNRTVRSRR